MAKLFSRWVIVGAIAAGLGSVGLLWWFSPQLRGSVKPEAPSSAATPSPSPLRQEVTALGRLEPAGGIVYVSAPSTLGSVRVARLLVKQGDRVQVNQPIAVLDSYPRLYAAVLQADAQIKEAQSRLAQVRAGAKAGDIAAQKANVARIEAELLKSGRDYQRYQMLYRNGAIAATELESRRLSVETLTRELEQARQVLSSVAEVRPTDIQNAEAQVIVAGTNLQRAKAELETAVITAPINGQVIEVYTDPGEVVGNQGIVALGNTAQMYAVAEVYETDIGQVAVGQKATIRGSAFNGTINGTVERVGLQIRKNDVLNTDPAADTDARVVEVKIRLNESQKVAGLTNLQVQVAIATPPLLIP